MVQSMSALTFGVLALHAASVMSTPISSQYGASDRESETLDRRIVLPPNLEYSPVRIFPPIATKSSSPSPSPSSPPDPAVAVNPAPASSSSSSSSSPSQLWPLWSPGLPKFARSASALEDRDARSDFDASVKELERLFGPVVASLPTSTSRKQKRDVHTRFDVKDLEKLIGPMVASLPIFTSTPTKRDVHARFDFKELEKLIGPVVASLPMSTPAPAKRDVAADIKELERLLGRTLTDIERRGFDMETRGLFSFLPSLFKGAFKAVPKLFDGVEDALDSAPMASPAPWYGHVARVVVY